MWRLRLLDESTRVSKSANLNRERKSERNGGQRNTRNKTWHDASIRRRRHGGSLHRVAGRPVRGSATADERQRWLRRSAIGTGRVHQASTGEQSDDRALQEGWCRSVAICRRISNCRFEG